MKIPVFFLLLLGASTFVNSQGLTEQDISDLVRLKIYRFFDLVVQQIVDAGLDPLQIEKAEYNKAIVPSVLEIGAFVNDLNMVGLSKISVTSTGYYITMRRMTVDLAQSWTNPFNLTIGNSELNLKVFDKIYKFELSGSLVIENFALASLIDFEMNNGIGVSNVVLNFEAGNIKPNLTVKAFGNDYSAAVNKFLEETLIDYLDDNRDKIDTILAAIAKFALNELFKRPFLP